MDAPTNSFERSTLLRHTCSIDQHQATFNESIKNRRKNYTSKQLLVIFSYIYGNFFLAACVSLQAPFFPMEAETKGASATLYGLVFGAYELAIILVSPLVGKLVGRSSPRIWIQFGLSLTGLATIVFGFLDQLPAGPWFISMAFLVRILEGIGAASFTTPSYTATAEEFPQDQATILSLLETAFGLGLICGPTLGGWLFQLGGYTLPFLTLGFFLLLGALLNFVVSCAQVNIVQDPCERQAGYLKILLSPGVLLDSLCVVTSLTFIGFNAATLEPHLRQFGLSVMSVGSVFIITGTIYALTTPLWGKLCKHYNTRVLCLLGSLLCLIGFTLIGPLPLIQLNSSLELVISALLLIGLGTGVKLVAALVGSFRYSIDVLGMPDNKSTFGICSSIYHTSTSIGAFFGPSLGGLLVDRLSYRNSCYFLFTLELVLLLGLFVFLSSGSLLRLRMARHNYTNLADARTEQRDAANSLKPDQEGLPGGY